MKFLAPRRQRGTFLSRPRKLLVLTTCIPVTLQWVLQPTLSPPLHSTTCPKLHLGSISGLELGRLQTQRLSCFCQPAPPHSDSSFPVIRLKAWSQSRLPSFSPHIQCLGKPDFRIQLLPAPPSPLVHPSSPSLSVSLLPAWIPCRLPPWSRGHESLKAQASLEQAHPCRQRAD